MTLSGGLAPHTALLLLTDEGQLSKSLHRVLSQDLGRVEMEKETDCQLFFQFEGCRLSLIVLNPVKKPS